VVSSEQTQALEPVDDVAPRADVVVAPLSPAPTLDPPESAIIARVTPAVELVSPVAPPPSARNVDLEVYHRRAIYTEEIVSDLRAVEGMDGFWYLYTTKTFQGRDSRVLILAARVRTSECWPADKQRDRTYYTVMSVPLTATGRVSPRARWLENKPVDVPDNLWSYCDNRELWVSQPMLRTVGADPG
jgi:hypothetical protein